MTPERWTQVEQLFDAVADLPPHARAANWWGHIFGST